MNNSGHTSDVIRLQLILVWRCSSVFSACALRDCTASPSRRSPELRLNSSKYAGLCAICLFSAKVRVYWNSENSAPVAQLRSSATTEIGLRAFRRGAAIFGPKSLPCAGQRTCERRYAFTCVCVFREKAHEPATEVGVVEAGGVLARHDLVNSAVCTARAGRGCRKRKQGVKDAALIREIRRCGHDRKNATRKGSSSVRFSFACLLACIFLVVVGA